MAGLRRPPLLTRHLTARQLRELLDRHGVRPSRALGQNFVVDANTIDRIVRLARVSPGDLIAEIGPGVGSLTLGLASAGAEVVAVELDRHLLPLLGEVTAGLDVTVVEADARAVDWPVVLGGRHAAVVANLPYNIATQLVIGLLDDVPLIDRLFVMVQREVAERLAAGAGDAAYGIPSVLVSLHATARVVGTVPASVFHPQPKVASALVDVRRHPAGSAPVDGADRAVVGALVRRAFGQRRKMLRRSLEGAVTEAQFAAAGIDPARRPESLTVDEWVALAAVVRSAD